MAAAPHRPGFALLGGNRVPREFDRPIVAEKPSWEDLEPCAGPYTVGVVDTGIVLDADGKPPTWFGEGHLSMCAEDDTDIIEGSSGHLDEGDGHGTFVAGLILREAPAARIRMWGVLDKQRPRAAERGGLDSVDDFAVAAAIRALALNPNVKVINLSFGGGVFAEHKPPTQLKDALDLLDYDRVAVVAAAGNDGIGDKVWPAAFEHVISVGAVEESGPLEPGDTPPFASFTNHGDWITAFANGKHVLGPFVDYMETGEVDGHASQDFKGWARWSGTSFAAAIVSGRIAQLAAERGIPGALAAKELLAEAPKIRGNAVWIRGVDSP